MGQRTGDFAERLCARGSGAGRAGVEVDCAGVQVAPARKVKQRETVIVSLPDGRRRGSTRRDVGDLGGARRAGSGVGSAENVTGCTACPSAPVQVP